VPGELKIIGRPRPKFSGKGVLVAGASDDGASPGNANQRCCDRFGTETMILAGLHSEDVAGKMKGTDLPATIAEHLVRAHRAADDLIEIIRRLTLAINLGISVEPDRGANRLEGVAKGIAMRGAGIEIARRVGGMPFFAAGNLGDHVFGLARLRT